MELGHSKAETSGRNVCVVGRLAKSIAVLACLNVACGFALAQGVASSGEIQGVVTDPSGASVPRASVTVADELRGLRRASFSDNNGRFRFTGLAPASYTVSAEAAGFSTLVERHVTVQVNETVNLNLALQVASASTQVIVDAKPAAVETRQASQAGYIGAQQITSLPINRRDYLSFALLLPGVSDSNTIASSTDFRVQQTPQSGISVNGSNGRGNSITIDGGEANEDSGGVRLTVSQEAVQEFQVNRSGYSAELGGSSGAAINIVTKSGTNAVHGSLFGFFRDSSLDARDRFAFGSALNPGQVFNPAAPDTTAAPVKNALSRQQFGGSLGLPLVKNRTFLFLAYEGLRRDEQAAVPLLTTTAIFRPDTTQRPILAQLAARGTNPVPCLTGRASLPAAVCANVLQGLLTINPAASGLSQYIVNQMELNGGLLPFSASSDLGSIRIDHRFNDSNQTFLRLNAGRDDESDPNLQALTGYSRGTLSSFNDYTALGSWVHIFDPSILNEARFQWNSWSQKVASNDVGGPSIDIPGFAALGRNIFLPSNSALHRYEMADTVTVSRGRQTWRAGGSVLVRADNTSSQTFFAGRFVFGSLPGGVLSPCLQAPVACGLPSGTNPASINSLQAFSLGLPQYYQQGFGDPVVKAVLPLTGLFVEDSWQVRPNLTVNLGMRYELDQRSGPMPTTLTNFAPRVSFAWDPGRDRKTVVRGGYGIFYSPIYYQIDAVVRTLGNVNGRRQISQVFVPLTGAPGNPSLTSAAIFQRLFAQGKIGCGVPAGAACITPSDLTQFGITVAQTGPVAPLSALFGVDSAYRNPYTQQANFGIEREVWPGWSISASYIYAHTLHLPQGIDRNLLPAPVSVINGAAIRNWAAPQCSINPTACFANPLLLQNNIYSSTANALYNAGIIELRRRAGRYVTALVNYTFSKALDDSTDYNSDYEAFDQTNLRAEHALSDFDQRHRLIVSGTFESPFRGRILHGFLLAPIFRANSGRPFNLLAGTDVNGDRHSTNDRPAGAGRNTGMGPAYYSLDARLSRSFELGERVRIQVVAEGFNLINRTNYASVNNVVGNISGPFNLSGTADRSPSQPLGFTSALPSRQLQLGFRMIF
jgi:Carboxypeptidase regulatory-like domain